MGSSPFRYTLPNGRRIASWNPVREFEKNVKNRIGTLYYATEEHPDRKQAQYLARLWEQDAINRRRGMTGDDVRATAMNMTLEGMRAFDAKVLELERTVWKKAADFYAGMLSSGLFNQTLVLHGGVYHDHRFLKWRQIPSELGVSRATVLRRKGAGMTGVDLVKPARMKAKAVHLEFEGSTYTPMTFSSAFGISKHTIRSGIAAGLTPTELLAAPKRPRGRPRKRRLGAPSIVLEELKFPRREPTANPA